MKTTALIFRKRNFLILDSIMHDGSLCIEGKMIINPLDKNFDKPIKANKPKKE